MVRFFSLVCIGLLLSVNLFAQETAEELIISTIDRFFEGMRTADEAKIRETLAENCSLRTVVKSDSSGRISVLDENVERFIHAVTQKREGLVFDERILDYQIKVDAEMAMAWAPYTFYVNRRRVHCGVNLFTLVYMDEQWKIVSIIDTRRHEPCPSE
ncbi:nuclear transport factor 2 family protein [Marinilongibacter aquaticus]|uniref:nuclear transport factor 2 family protein n=1 Tax=Marinilongibacter aquaticus TaxID=2975157 RepID=UPI0021BD82F4|nr:nuclear transport factor 2 family protein [Marinilongibacter aquaticus]UBM58325.1 nuclear transport factor 2 family protein [Marinilongibacter aquaticus]